MGQNVYPKPSHNVDFCFNWSTGQPLFTYLKLVLAITQRPRSDGLKLSNFFSKYPKKLPTMSIGLKIPEELSLLSRKPQFTISL